MWSQNLYILYLPFENSKTHIAIIYAIYIEEIAAIWGNEVKVTHALVCSNAVYGGNKNLESGWEPQN